LAASPLVGSGEWKTHTFELTDIRFENRSNGADFRLNVKASAATMPQVCFSRVSVTFTDDPLAAYESLAILSPSLIFREGTAAVEFGTPADEVAWRLGDPNDVELRTGTAAAPGGRGTIDLNDLPFGYYTLDVTAQVNGAAVTRTTSLAVLDDPPEGWDDDDAFFGTQFHRGWQPRPETDALSDATELAGYGLGRIETTWGEVETSPGEYTFTSEGVRVLSDLAGRGIDTMWTAGLTHSQYDNGRTPASPEAIAAFAAYAGATAEYYASNGITHDVGILNEYNSSGFNNGTCGLTAACYLDVLGPTSAAIHDADPDANVIGPVTAGVQLAWAQDFIDGGGLELIDTYATNYYGYAQNGPGTPPEETTELMENLPALVEKIRGADGGATMPIRVTENGWPTHTAGSTQSQQADYAIRGLVLAQAAGANSYLWYDLYDDGFDPGEREDNFGLINRADATSCHVWVCPDVDGYEYGAVHGISPKPGFVSQAVLIRQTTGREQGAREDLGSESAFSYPYTGKGAPVRVLWSTGTDTVTVQSSGGFTLTDQFGQAREVAGGGVKIALTGSPVFVQGDVTVKGSNPAVTLDVPETSVAGQPLPVTLAVADRTDLPPVVEVSADGVSQTVRVNKGKATLQLPGVGRRGERKVTVTVTDGDRVLTQARGATEVVDPFAVTGRPVVEKDGDGHSYGLDLTVRNNSTTADLALDALRWSAGGSSGEAEAPTVPAGDSATVRVSVPDPAPYTLAAYTAEATAGGVTLADEGRLSFSPIEPDGEATLDPIDLNTLGKWQAIRSGTRTGPEDIGGDLRFTATDDALVLHATITDDVHHAERTDPALSWQVDSIQFNTYDLFPSELGGERVEIAASLYDAGPVVYTFTPPAGQSAGPTPGAQADIVRDDAAGTTTYDLAVPWASLGYDGPPSDVFGLSFLVNDADGDVPGTDARSGYVEWGSGVGGAPKDPAKFQSVQVVGLGS
jgi:trimeric autotransporter adhesin